MGPIWMRAARILLGLMLIPAVGVARPGPEAAPEGLLADVSARPPPAASAVPPAILETLPPGIRNGDATPAGPAWPALGGAFGPETSRRLVERLVPPVRDVGEPDWIELEYTIDRELDALARRVLRSGRVALGHVILMDPATGEVLAYVSTDPDTFPATRTYPTASLAKVVTAAAVLRHAPAAAERDCRYEGSPYRVRRSHLQPPRAGGRVDSFWRALALSNNQCFARLAVHDLGAERVLAEIERVGLLEAPAVGHAPGRLEPIEDSLDLGYLGSGLAGSYISPLAAARLAAVLARGELVRPRWLARVSDSRGRTLLLPPPEPPRAVWSPEVTTELRELLVGVTTRGTAKSAFRDSRGRPLLGPVLVSGKTGSLSGVSPKGRYEWFIGVAPAEQPRIAIATVVVNGALWWRNASQIAAEVLKGVFCEGRSCGPESLERFRAVRPGAVSGVSRPADGGA